MTTTAQYARSLFRYLTQRSARHANDASTHRELKWDGAGLPEGLSITWLGTSGFAIAAEGTTLVIDPYVSRAPAGEIVRRRVLGSNDGLRRRLIPQADAILIGHTHFDHVIDAPALSAELGAVAYGSESLAHLYKLHGMPERAVRVQTHRAYDIGPFRVTFIPSVHSKLLLGKAIPSGGNICCEHLDGLTSRAYGCGQVFGIHIDYNGFSLYHQGSADLLDEEITHRGVDVFLAGIAGRGFTRDYAARILRLLEPQLIVAHHFDDFFRPVEAPLDFSLNVNLGAWVEEARTVSRDFSVRTLSPLETISA